MKAIGLTGLAGSGKDTVAKLIKDNYAGKVMLYALADPLKEACAIAFGVPVAHFYDEKKKEMIDEFWGMTRREMLQKFGTEAMRNTFDDAFWIKRAQHFVEHAEKQDIDLLVVTDIRFDNEAEWIIDDNGGMFQGVLVEVVRNDMEMGEKHLHCSELGVESEIEWVILNDSSLEDLRMGVNNLIEYVYEK